MTDSSDSVVELQALQGIITALQPLDPETRRRIFDAAATFLQIASGHVSSATPASGYASPSTTPYPSFSEDTSMSPKEFLFQKQPRTDVERIAALAYYLTHYRDTPHFKTLDLSKLNTEAAQPKFANAASSSNNAVKQGYLVSSVKGQRQLTAAGEQFINALPDRDAARVAMNAAMPRRRSQKRSSPRQTAATE